MADRNICWSTKADGIKEMAIELTSNAEKADTRVWLHVKWAAGNVLLFSPDIDVYYNIGLLQEECDYVIIQLNAIGRDTGLL